MTIFYKIIERTLSHEGGYLSPEAARRQGDPGGETQWGISKRSYPTVNIRALTRDQAIEIYRKDFWNVIHGEELHPAFAFQALDAAINSGIGNAVRWTQRAAGMADDGHFGPATKAAVLATSPSDMVLLFNAERLEFMTKLTNWPINSKGWARRICNNMRYAAKDN